MRMLAGVIIYYYLCRKLTRIMARKSKAASKPRTVKQRSINVSEKLHDQVKEYCTKYNLTQVDFVEISLKVLNSLNGDPRQSSSTIPAEVTQAINDLKHVENTLLELTRKTAANLTRPTNGQIVRESFPSSSTSYPAHTDGRPSSPSPLPHTIRPASPSSSSSSPITPEKDYSFEAVKKRQDNSEMLDEKDQIILIKRQICPKCGSLMKMQGPISNRFLCCSQWRNYPACEYKAEGTFFNPIVKDIYKNGVLPNKH